MEQIERFVVLLYQRASAHYQVNEARINLFPQNRKMDNISSTFHALDQHLKRAVYQASHIWGQCLVPNPEHPSQSLWGWQLMTMRRVHAGLPFQRQPEIAKNCWNVGEKGTFGEMQMCESKHTMHKPMVPVLFGTMYQRFDDLTCIMSFVAYMVLCVDIYWLVAQKWWWYSYLVIHNNGAGAIHRYVFSHSQQWWWVLLFTNSQ